MWGGTNGRPHTGILTRTTPSQPGTRKESGAKGRPSLGGGARGPEEFTENKTRSQPPKPGVGKKKKGEGSEKKGKKRRTRAKGGGGRRKEKRRGGSEKRDGAANFGYCSKGKNGTQVHLGDKGKNQK